MIDFGIQFLHSSPYYAQSNGQAETSNKLILHLVLGFSLRGGAKKRKKKTYTKPKKSKHKHKKVKLAVLKYYQVDDESGRVHKLRKECYKCGPRTFMSHHFDRHYCGKCGFTRFTVEGFQFRHRDFFKNFTKIEQPRPDYQTFDIADIMESRRHFRLDHPIVGYGNAYMNAGGETWKSMSATETNGEAEKSVVTESASAKCEIHDDEAGQEGSS